MKQQILGESTIAAAEEQVSCDIGGESAILNLSNGVYYGLDPLGARIWELIREPKTVYEVRDVIVAEYDVEPEVCERDLLALLEQLSDEGLIQVRNGQAA